MLLTVLAVIVSLGHVVCSTPAFAAPIESFSAHHFRAEVPLHEHGGSHTNHKNAPDHGAPCDPDDGPCSHCASAQMANAGGAKLVSAGAPDQTPVAILADTLDAVSPAHVVRTNLLRSRWMPPPGETPVSLKVRLLN